MSKDMRSSAWKLGALADALAKDALKLSDEEVLAELAEDGIPAMAHAQAIRVSVMGVLAEARKKKLLTARKNYETSIAVRPVPKNRPPLAEIKRQIERLFTARNDLSLAFRNGSRQSEDDWMSLWDDLAEMGLFDKGDE